MKTFTTLMLLGALLSTPTLCAQGSGLIIPMPGDKQIEKAKEELKKPVTEQKPNRPASQNGTLIPLPTKIKHVAPKPQAEPDPAPEKTESKPLIVIPARPDPEPKTSNEEFPSIPDEVVIEPDSLTPPVDLPNENVDQGSGSSMTDEYPLFPKDTSSAVFMVMKTWQCENYDGNTLLSHAVEVYAQEAGETFQIKGLDPAQPFLLNLDEEDITLDELLDLIALKTGRDWGADVPGRTIYFYPKGIKTEGVGSW